MTERKVMDISMLASRSEDVSRPDFVPSAYIIYAFSGLSHRGYSNGVFGV